MKSWTVIDYRVIDQDKAQQYHPTAYRQETEDAIELTKKLIRYMDEKMEKEVTIAWHDAKQDFGVFGSVGKRREIKKPLSESKSAMALHDRLKKLYP